MSHHLSGSKWHLAVGAIEDPVGGCLYWAREDVVLPVTPPGKPALVGTAAHAIGAAVAEGKPEPDPRTNEEWEALPYGNQLGRWLKETGLPTSAEMAIVYDTATDTARQVVGAGHRDYGELKPTEIPTTLDYVWAPADPSAPLDITDAKTGKRENTHAAQLLIQALAATRLLGRTSARVAFTFVRKTKCTRDDWTTLDESRLEAEAWRASAVMRRLPMAKPQPGAWCFRCPLGKASCPEWVTTKYDEDVRFEEAV